MPRPHGEPTPAKLAEWEARRYSALRRIRDAARLTPVDDVLPENPQAHEDETRSALSELEGA